MKNKTKIIVAVLVQMMVLINLVLTAMGKNPLPFSSNEVEVVLSGAVAIVVSMYNCYKNRNVTTAAQKGQEITDLIKSGSVYMEEVQAFIDDIKKQEVE